MKGFEKLWDYFEAKNNTKMTKHFEDFYVNFIDGIKDELTKEELSNMVEIVEEEEVEEEPKATTIILLDSEKETKEVKEIKEEQHLMVAKYASLDKPQEVTKCVALEKAQEATYYVRKTPILPQYIDYDIGFLEKNLDSIDNTVIIQNRPEIRIFVNRYFFKTLNVLFPEERGRSYILLAQNAEGIFTKRQMFSSIVCLLKTIMGEQQYEKMLRNVKFTRLSYNYFHQNYNIEYNWSLDYSLKY
jgi:hypothetical protein